MKCDETESILTIKQLILQKMSLDVTLVIVIDLIKVFVH